MAMKGQRIHLVVSRWGKTLAIRLPAKSARKIGVSEGDKLVVEISIEGLWALAPKVRPIGKSESRRLRQFINSQGETTPIAE
jgi:antitoxin component of MazEF toxin-antitoxin module